jgi:energy-coupling factor transporter ATP-binding protein EcfA2
MATTDLLTAVLAPEGWYCIVGLKQEGHPKQVFMQTLQEAEDAIDDLLQKKYDVYFACAKYENDTDGRTQKNSTYFKSFWIDVDCGVGKPYETQADGLDALKQFCNTIHWPLPTIVNSGRGIHAYWRLATTVNRAEWKAVADRLKALCAEHEFDADPSRTAESASILRVPETFNFKQDPPLPVEILHVADQSEYDHLRQLLGVLVAPDYIPRQLNEMTKALMGNRQSRFKTIMMKTIDGKGCAQLEHIALNQDTIEEPLWRAGLSIAAHCIDKDEAIHKISSAHPSYSPDETERKAAQTKGPYTCDTFAKLNPEGCNACPNKGKISSPILLGNEIVAAEAGTPIVEQTPEGKQEEYVVPELPFPYFRGKNGGVYATLKTKGDDDEVEEKVVNIYEHDLYVVKRLKDPIKGDAVWIRLHLPRDGVREFSMPQTDALTFDKLRDKLAWHGVVAAKKQMDAIMNYLIAFVKELQHKTQVEIMRTQFGWTERNDEFILGEKEIAASGTTYSPPSSTTGSLASYLVPTGDYDEWKRIAKTYDQPQFEPHAFGFFTAFGAPLLKHLNLKGAIINLINNTSGTGKSTVLKMCNSVWGHPEELMLQWKDTQNAMIHRLGVMNNLPVTIDEITKMSGDHFSDLVYSISQGRGKNRMMQHSNEERHNATKWATIALCSSNASFYDKLASLKSTPDGEFMRLIEYRIEVTDILSKEEADAIFTPLYSHYGHAGVQYAEYLVGNLEAAVDLVMQVQQKIDKAVGLTSRERFWSGAVACNIAGALIAKDLGIIDFDIKRVYDWIVQELKTMRTEIKAPAQSQASVIGEFMNDHRRSTLVINGEADARTGLGAVPILDVKFGELLIRVEPDTKLLYINAKHLRNYCSKQQITLKDTLKGLEADGIYKGQVKKRMSKGTEIQTPAVHAYVFSIDNNDFINAEDYITAAIQDADSSAELQS